ncbi:hypothetical protein GCM10007036_32190 [Alsobacter metallidurans]|uniref:Uncharacterized protein n=1 Tax=Alsobacter metallidurans TaxID=340221 RepID=A0A917I8S4_9HYPH|nr:hypothetical protein [Alsobacter metallidurans]GGH25215.1 hypothetical protein GCM10007036_32190 [Alsobacter metallidurans]
MFAKDNKRLPVTLTLADGRTLVGAITAGLSASIASALNREGLFLEFIAENGELLFIGKNSIMMVREGAIGRSLDVPAIAMAPGA